jgi:hypothetical protein
MAKINHDWILNGIRYGGGKKELAEATDRPEPSESEQNSLTNLGLFKPCA